MEVEDEEEEEEEEEQKKMAQLINRARAAISQSDRGADPKSSVLVVISLSHPYDRLFGSYKFSVNVCVRSMISSDSLIS